jgi:hypothetical protein
MASKSNSLDSAPLSATYSPSSGGTIKTNEGTKQIELLTSKSKCAIAAFVVEGVAGVVIIILGTTNLFGPVGSIGFVVSIAGGGTVAIIATGGVIWIAVSNCKRAKDTTAGTLNNAGAMREAVETGEEVKTKKETSGVADKVSDKPYPEIGTQAIEFARQKLSKHPEIKPRDFSAGWEGFSKTYQPVNQEIALLTTLYWDVYFTAFTQEVKKHADPWSRPTVIQAADDLMKIAYAISCLTLEDLPEFTQALEKKGEKRSFVEALTIQDSYQYRTYYDCTKAYHWIRGGIAWSKSEWSDKKGLFQPKEAPKTHAENFYTKGTIQSDWRALYNDYCDRVRLYVKEADLKKADNRHFTWTKKDEGATTFRHTPDTLPT